MASAEGLVAQLDALLATTVAQEAFDKLGRRLATALTGKTDAVLRPYRGARDGRRGTYPVRENLFDTESYDGNVGERSGGDGEHRQLF